MAPFWRAASAWTWSTTCGRRTAPPADKEPPWLPSTIAHLRPGCRLPRDEDGALAAKGHVHDDYVTQYLRHSYFGSPPPKSLDRNTFPLELVDRLSPEDGAATLTAFTAASIAGARAHFPEQPQLWIISGGGRRNKTLMAMIAGLVDAAVAPAE